MKTITISRQYGSGGRYIAALLSEKMGVPCYDSKFLPKEAERHGISQEKTVKRLAQEGPCIFVGRCADQILKDDNQLLRVYIYASDMEDRIKRIKKNKHISQEEALDRIAYKDRQRRDYYNFYTGHEWGKMENYDICLNTSVLSEEECVELLMKLAE